MHDVARLAGVSISTVSALINGAPKVSEARAERIRRAMQALDYHPDQIARSLKVGRTQTIGVVIPDITNAFYPAVFRGIEDAARAAGYSLLLCNSNEDAEQERTQLNTLFSRRVDGVLLACSNGSTAYDTFLHRRFPLVFVDRVPRGIVNGAVCTDNVEAGRMAAQHVIDQGHTRIALLSGNLGLTPHADRLEGFRRAMGEARVPVREDYLRASGMHVEDGRSATARLLQLPESPTAIIATNSKLLLGLLHELRARRIAVPRDLSIVTFDEHEWSDYIEPRITAVVQPAYEIGRQGFELLNGQIGRDATSAQAGMRSLHAQLRLGGSTGTPRK